MSTPEDMAAVAASLAETAEKLAGILAHTDHWFSLVLLARREGYEAGFADAREPRSALARHRRAELRVVPGRTAARKGKSGGAG